MLDERDGRSRDEKRLDVPLADLPLADPAPQPEASRDAGSREVGVRVRERAAPGPTVMIVDDDDAIREALEDVLSDEGYRIVGMSDGQQALDHLNAEGQPAAILLDLWMPVMDGWKFLDALLDDSRFRRIPLIVLTAARDQRARDLRVSEVLTKPVQLQQVLSALERLTKVS
jgi:CheY-like chemotaxis protein